MAGLSVGGCVGYYHGQFSELRDDIVALKPSIFCGVPRVYHIIYNQIISELESKPVFRIILFIIYLIIIIINSSSFNM